VLVLLVAKQLRHRDPYPIKGIVDVAEYGMLCPFLCSTALNSPANLRADIDKQTDLIRRRGANVEI